MLQELARLAITDEAAVVREAIVNLFAEAANCMCPREQFETAALFFVMDVRERRAAGKPRNGDTKALMMRWLAVNDPLRIAEAAMANLSDSLAEGIPSKCGRERLLWGRLGPLSGEEDRQITSCGREGGEEGRQQPQEGKAAARAPTLRLRWRRFHHRLHYVADLQFRWPESIVDIQSL
jgi:hypothetical protein